MQKVYTCFILKLVLPTTRFRSLNPILAISHGPISAFPHGTIRSHLLILRLALGSLPLFKPCYWFYSKPCYAIRDLDMLPLCFLAN